MKNKGFFTHSPFKSVRNSRLLAAIAAIFSGLIILDGVIGGFATVKAGFDYAISPLISDTKIEQTAYEKSDDEIIHEKLLNLNTGISFLKLEQQLAVQPDIKRTMENEYWIHQEDGKLDGPYKSEELGLLTERIYAFPQVYLQVITDTDEMVVSYTITLRKEDFLPNIEAPYVFNDYSRTLGEFTYGNINFETIETNAIQCWVSIPCSYVESHYQGTGIYRHYLFGSVASGAATQSFQTELSEMSSKHYKNRINLLTDESFLMWRGNAKPNAFTVIEGYDKNNDLLNLFLYKGIGINIRDAAKINNFQPLRHSTTSTIAN